MPGANSSGNVNDSARQSSGAGIGPVCAEAYTERAHANAARYCFMCVFSHALAHGKLSASMKSVPLRRRLILLAAVGILPLAIMSGVSLIALFKEQRDQGGQAGLEI